MKQDNLLVVDDDADLRNLIKAIKKKSDIVIDDLTTDQITTAPGAALAASSTNSLPMKPLRGGRPAIVAKATAWGSTIRAPVIPAVASARVLERVTRSRQRRNGNNLNQCAKEGGALLLTYSSDISKTPILTMIEVCREAR